MSSEDGDYEVKPAPEDHRLRKVYDELEDFMRKNKVKIHIGDCNEIYLIDDESEEMSEIVMAQDCDYPIQNIPSPAPFEILLIKRIE